MTRDELEQSYWSLLGLHKRGGLSEPGLIESLVLLAVEYAAGDDVAAQEARRRILARAK